jgi:hypothetical protein
MQSPIGPEVLVSRTLKIDYKLKPSVGRLQKYADKGPTLLCPKQEIDLLHRFRRRAYPLLGRMITAGEAIFIARHHQLPTRLLDWTANALFSLYFACCEKHKKDGKVWAMKLRASSEDWDAFELAGRKTECKLFAGPKIDDKGGACVVGQSEKYLKFVHPFYNSPRLLAQDGAFTFHSDPWKPIENYKGEEFTTENLDIEMLCWWRIPSGSKGHIVRELSSLGVTQRSVFPDLDGVAKSLWETEVLWSAPPEGGATGSSE